MEIKRVVFYRETISIVFGPAIVRKVGDKIEMDEAVLEIATDKVDSEVPSEVAGTLVEILFNTDDVVQVGQTIAIIETEGDAVASTPVISVIFM